ncbi:MAG: biopolymer transporter ExbD [Bacteroidetes bacterium]|nr:biopolymer transporter ExbD [Bacteroidota bacterium]
MSRPKIARKSTHVDMTAMCDVAFLLLTFFILTTKPKPSEAVPITTPNSVANKFVPDKEAVMISLDKNDHVYLSISDNALDRAKKKAMIDDINQRNKLGLTDDEIVRLVKQPFIGVAFSQLKQQAQMTDGQINSKNLPGIPTQDTSNNQLIEWIQAAVTAYQGEHMDLILKGDNVSKYPALKNILTAFKKNEQFKFQMVTTPSNVPTGTDLYKENMSKSTSDKM